jgi:hypothetical protein
VHQRLTAILGLLISSWCCCYYYCHHPAFEDKTIRGAGIYYLKIGLLYYSNPNIFVSPYNVERSGLLP